MVGAATSEWAATIEAAEVINDGVTTSDANENSGLKADTVSTFLGVDQGPVEHPDDDAIDEQACL
jgi:hypothetical protein